MECELFLDGRGMSVLSAVWPLKDLGDLTKKTDTIGSAILALVLPVCAGCAGAILAADGLKAPTHKARMLIGASLGATIAGTATTGLSGNRWPGLALAALVCGASAGMLGASSLRSDVPERKKSERSELSDATKARVEAARQPASADRVGRGVDDEPALGNN
jgi:MFS family permease